MCFIILNYALLIFRLFADIPVYLNNNQRMTSWDFAQFTKVAKYTRRLISCLGFCMKRHLEISKFETRNVHCNNPISKHKDVTFKVKLLRKSLTKSSNLAVNIAKEIRIFKFHFIL